MNKRINNKGFTLVELLSVMVILISISLVVVVSITSSLERGDEKECQQQIELAINSAKIYFSMEGGSSVSVETLVSSGYIKDDQRVDKIKLDGVIKIDCGGLSCSYVFDGLCD